jgi:hypothetical protein
LSYRISVLISLTLATQQLATGPVRTVRDNTLVSDQLPAVSVEVQKDFKFLGRIPLNIHDIAVGERFIFVQAGRNRHITRMFIVQMEGFLPGVDDIYRWKMENPIKLGHQDYRHNISFYDNEAEIRQNPGSEAEATMSFLKAKGYLLDPELMQSRFARVVGDDRRHEFLLFYTENMKDRGLKLADFSEDKPASARKLRIEKALTKRSLQVFKISDTLPPPAPSYSFLPWCNLLFCEQLT